MRSFLIKGLEMGQWDSSWSRGCGLGGPKFLRGQEQRRGTRQGAWSCHCLSCRGMESRGYGSQGRGPWWGNLFADTRLMTGSVRETWISETYRFMGCIVQFPEIHGARRWTFPHQWACSQEPPSPWLSLLPPRRLPALVVNWPSALHSHHLDSSFICSTNIH